ncbi:MAG: hypothetical protein EP343_11885 [Deltaproteobacteria bacterium]|nr:MAG: hypothetical protein EP343_11885 [Deltaproteobacteria bacterium]
MSKMENGSPEVHHRWRSTGEWLWLLRIPVFSSVFALGLAVVLFQRGNLWGAFASLGWLGAIILSVVVWRRQAAHARKLYQKHRITSEELSQTKRRTMTEEIVETVEHHEDVVWLSLPSVLEEGTLEVQQARWERALDEGKRFFFLDGSRLDDLSREGLQALEQLDTTLEQLQGKLLFLKVPTELRLKLELLSPKLGKQVYSDRESAMWVVWGRMS